MTVEKKLDNNLYVFSVIAMDIDPLKIEMAKHNAKIYGVYEKITFVVGDFFQLANSTLRVDVLCTSPPWGGPSYLKQKSFSVQGMLDGRGFAVIDIARRLAPKVAIHLPRTTDVQEVSHMAEMYKYLRIQSCLISYILLSFHENSTSYFGQNTIYYHLFNS